MIEGEVVMDIHTRGHFDSEVNIQENKEYNEFFRI